MLNSAEADASGCLTVFAFATTFMLYSNTGWHVVVIGLPVHCCTAIAISIYSLYILITESLQLNHSQAQLYESNVEICL